LNPAFFHVFCSFFFFCALGAFCGGSLFAQDNAVARKYEDWAQRAINEGHWKTAEEALNRASDFADISSDLSYMLAEVQNRQGRPLDIVLRSVENALQVDQWNRYNKRDAILLKTEALVTLRRYNDALTALDQLNEDLSRDYIKLRALKGLALENPASDDPSGEDAFLKACGSVMERFPRSAKPVKLLFQFAALTKPSEEARNLIDLALRRLPELISDDPELSYLVVPFIRDKAEARRLIEAYRAGGGMNQEAIPAALRLKIIDEKKAEDELFAGTDILKSVLLALYDLCPSKDAKIQFEKRLSVWSGCISGDDDGDGVIETKTLYDKGLLTSYTCDARQDRRPVLQVSFKGGFPSEAEAVLLADKGETRFHLVWNRYPAVSTAVLSDYRFIFRPREFLYAPIRFRELGRSSLLLVERNRIPGNIPRISERSLVMYALKIERPSPELRGSTEIIDMKDGIIQRAQVFRGGKVVSDTEFARGRPIFQHIDLDGDGRMETLRRFPSNENALEEPADPLDNDFEKGFISSERDLDGDGIYEVKN
jgi:hypothetical protein